MTSESSERRLVITLLLTSTLLTMLGIAGVLRGVDELSLGPVPEDVRELYEPGTEVTEAEVQLLEAQVSNPYRRPMAAANVVVSSLVLIGSFMLSWRRTLAFWWIRQAVLAKLIWIAAYTASLVHHMKVAFPPMPTGQPAGGLAEIMLGVILLGLFSAAIHVAAGYRATRPDIREFIESAGKSRN